MKHDSQMTNQNSSVADARCPFRPRWRVPSECASQYFSKSFSLNIIFRVFKLTTKVVERDILVNTPFVNSYIFDY